MRDICQVMSRVGITNPNTQQAINTCLKCELKECEYLGGMPGFIPKGYIKNDNGEFISKARQIICFITNHPDKHTSTQVANLFGCTRSYVEIIVARNNLGEKVFIVSDVVGDS